MGVSCMRPSRKLYGFVARSEVDIEPSDKSMYKVASTAVEQEGRLEGKICWIDSVEVNRENRRWIRDTSLHFYSINQGLC